MPKIGPPLYCPRVTARVAGIWRYPVKSMLGESLTECEVGPVGVVGDRAFALIDAEDGKVASAKNPRKWGGLLACRATFADASVVEIALPDGSRVRTDDPDVDARVSKAIGREVRVASTAPDDRAFEEVWPDIDGLAPEAVIAGTNIGTDDDGERISHFPLGSAAPPGTFFDLSVVHVLTTATLARLQALAPGSTFDVRRYRPNLLLEMDTEPGFVENGWVGRTVRVGESAEVSITLPTMRCVMTTLAQEELPRDRDTLRAIAAGNRVEIAGWGTWACAGAYGDVAAPGAVRVGDAVALS
jgi:uncharacterized protein YcbX